MKKDFDIFDQTSLLSNTLPNRNTFFVGREDELTEIDDLIFKKSRKIILIYSESGYGKSSIALEYGYRYISKNEENHHVYWMKSDRNNLETEFRSLAIKLGIVVEKIQDQYGLINEIKDRLLYYDKKVLFIFDNCENFEYIKSYIDCLHVQRNIFVIITTNIDYENEKFLIEKVKPNGFNSNYCFEYLKKKLGKTLDTDIMKILQIFCLDDQENISPLVLSSIAGYIDRKSVV